MSQIVITRVEVHLDRPLTDGEAESFAGEMKRRGWGHGDDEWEWLFHGRFTHAGVVCRSVAVAAEVEKVLGRPTNGRVREHNAFEAEEPR